jgi:transposase
MADSIRRRRPRRHFDDDFKAQAVRLVLHEEKTVGAAARDLDLTETALRDWVNRARADRTNGKTGLTTAEREELARLRKEVGFCGKSGRSSERRRPSSRTSGGEIPAHRRGEGASLARADVSLSARDAQRVLCAADAARAARRQQDRRLTP